MNRTINPLQNVRYWPLRWPLGDRNWCLVL